jgi:hypothetical protein
MASLITSGFWPVSRSSGQRIRLLASGNTRQRILEAYPYLENEDIDACLEYAALRVSEQEVDLATR